MKLEVSDEVRRYEEARATLGRAILGEEEWERVEDQEHRLARDERILAAIRTTGQAIALLISLALLVLVGAGVVRLAQWLWPWP